ncbi:hypothetical protein Bravens_00310 [Brevibacterium ravenspurgense]|uniref:DUF885 domain-containing protein n=1 Tax=Brevibacterium ravenspurgense TaxID=479117 RepID=A0A150HBA4_9MICO|nr:DUF885 domain-containing protein [Brevibacterium ravenspurgense]KXZ59376.1 hypothetical protein Bravens_00310 [Brevibacterium ravenspurgense]
MTELSRIPSAVDEVAEDYARSLVDLFPTLSVTAGLDGDRTRLDSQSREAADQLDELNARTLRELDKAEREAQNLDEVDAVTLDAMRERLGCERELHAAGLTSGELNVIASAPQDVQMLFDLVPTDTEDDWKDNAVRLSQVPRALTEYRHALSQAAHDGRPPALRQVKRVIEQCRDHAKADGSFDRFAQQAADTASEALSAEVRTAADGAREAYDSLADFLGDIIAPLATETDACGRDDYALFSRQFLGAEVDLDETYAWGLEQLAAIDAEQRRVANELYPGSTVSECFDKLNADPQRQVHGLDALRAWMQDKADRAIEELAGVHFDIPEPVKKIECMVLPDGTGGIYYTGPTDDFSRPGRMWWSVPAGVETFNTWQELTTVYHEGVPGHHLQVGGATHMADSLNTWRRHLCWVSGHGEGWALYSEALMAELGFLDDLGDYMGMLDSQRLRAARVCLDIGVHLGLPAPESIGGGTWDADKAWTFLTDNAAMERSFLAFELDRYLGWPGQAPSYKIGQRLWEQTRNAAKASDPNFTLKDFHTKALAIGSVGLDTLKRALT